MSRTNPDRDDSAFDPARERAIDDLIARMLPREPVAAPNDLRPDLHELLVRAEALYQPDAGPAFTEHAVGLASRALELAFAVRPVATRRAVVRMPRDRVFQRATGMGVYARTLEDATANLRHCLEQQGRSEFVPEYAQHLLVQAAVETLEVVVAGNPELAPEAPEIYSPAHPETIAEVQAAAASALADELDSMTLEEEQATSAADRDAASATAIDGSGLGGGGAPWVAASVDSSIREAILAMGPLAALRQGDDSGGLLVREAMINVAQRELVLLWWLANTDETRWLAPE